VIRKRAGVIRGLLMNNLNPFAQKTIREDGESIYHRFASVEVLKISLVILSNRFHAILTSHLDFSTHSTVNEPNTSEM
jgi:hypothetical protein